MNLSKQRGVSLIELMVAITIGLILLAGVISVFMSSKVTYIANEKTARLQENGRVALDLLSHDIRSAGYMGCSKGNFTSTLNSPASLMWNYSIPLQGFEATAANTWSPTYAAGTLNPAPRSGSDMVVVRTTRRDSNVLRLEAGLASFTAAPTVLNDTSILAGQVMMITNCLASSVFQVTAYTPGTPIGTIDHGVVAGTATTPGNATGDLGYKYDLGARVAALQTVIYYVANEPVTNEPSLYRQTGSTQPADLLIEGVESMQIAYAEDTGNDRIADVYRSASAVGNWDKVISVSISLLVRSAAEGGALDTKTYQLLPAGVGGQLVDPVDDARMRMVFPTTIALRNRAL